MLGLCKYTNIFGVPKQGVHRYRIYDIAIVDVVATIVVALLLGYVMKWNIAITICAMFLLGIVMHRMFCVRTTLDKWLFPTAS